MRTSSRGRRIDCAIPTPWYEATFARWQVAQARSSTYSAALTTDATSVRIATEIMREIRMLTAIHHRTVGLPSRKVLWLAWPSAPVFTYDQPLSSTTHLRWCDSLTQ